MLIAGTSYPETGPRVAKLVLDADTSVTWTVPEAERRHNELAAARRQGDRRGDAGILNGDPAAQGPSGAQSVGVDAAVGGGRFRIGDHGIAGVVHRDAGEGLKLPSTLTATLRRKLPEPLYWLAKMSLLLTEDCRS